MMRFKKSLVCLSILSLISSYDTFAANAFTNGDFEQGFTTTTVPAVTIPGWTSTGYIFTGYKAGLTLPPKSLDDILLTASGTAPQGITDIFVTSPNISAPYDYFLKGVTPTSTIILPFEATQTAIINLRSVHPVPPSSTNSISGTSAKPSGWTKYSKQATALSQIITAPSGNFHIKFKAAPVLENPAHTAKQQPFYAVQVNNLTTGRKGSNPLFFQWSYAAQAGVAWKTLTAGGTNNGSNATYTYTDVQNFDITLSSPDVSSGDQIELIVLASGCSPGGHDGHIYLDGVTTENTPPAGLSISVVADRTEVNPGGTICYTYTYNYQGTSNTNNVVVQANMPLTQNYTPPLSTSFVSKTDPTVGNGTKTCEFKTNQNILECTITSLSPGQTGTFNMCVATGGNWLPSYGPVNNGTYPISSTELAPVNGNLVQTQIVGTPVPSGSNLVVDSSGLLIDGKNPSLNNGDIYATLGSTTHYYTCTNRAPAATATDASCNISNLPPGFSVSGCTSSRIGAWTQPGILQESETVTCYVEGTAQSEISRQWDAVIESNASNNINTTENTATVPFSIYNNPADIPATLNGSTVWTPIYICCGRPVLLADLPIESDLAATYRVVSTTGNIRCTIGNSGGGYFVKVFGRPGTCIIQGTKDGQISHPLTLIAQ